MSKPNKEQLAANVVPVVREYIDAAIGEAIEALAVDLRILHERINGIAANVNDTQATVNAAQKSMELKMELMRKG